MSKRTDISQQIKKYLNGELDARAMHRLERQAQSDPFLRDALEGYELPGADHDKNLNELASRLKNRTSRKERKIIPLRLIATAATILIFLFAGLLWFINRPPESPQKQMVKVNLSAPVKKATPDTLLITEKKTEIATLTKKSPSRTVITRDAAVQENNIAQNTSSSPNADISIDSPVGNSDAKVTEADPIMPKDSLNLRRTAKVYNNLSGRVAGVSINNNIVKGIVKDETNRPIPGATVSIKGTNKAVVTDANGKFVLPDVSSYSTLAVASVGYSQQQIAVNKRDSIVIAMQPNNASLNEVVVVGYGTKKQTDDEQPVYEGAHPANNWSNFKKYLKDNAKSPDGKTGVVKVSFKVDQYGSLSDFKIIKSLSTETDNAAIQLIQNGPRWLTNTDRKPELVKVRIKFTTPK